MDNIIDRLLQFLNQSKVLHWQTRSYARHTAYGNFYDSLSDLIDEFVEVHFGKYGRVNITEAIQLQNLNEIQVKEFLAEMEEFLLGLNKQLDQTRDSDLLNIRDEMLGSVNKLKYLLTLE